MFCIMANFNYIPIVIVCSNGFSFVTTNLLSSNTNTFMYSNKCLLTTMDTMRLQKEMIVKVRMKHSKSLNNLSGLTTK